MARRLEAGLLPSKMGLPPCSISFFVKILITEALVSIKGYILLHLNVLFS
jgi:hypothetical protein